jgi:hypothetical protein
VYMYRREPCSVNQLSRLFPRFPNSRHGDTDLDNAQLGSLGHERCERPSRIPVRRDRIRAEVVRWLRHDQNERREVEGEKGRTVRQLSSLPFFFSLPNEAQGDVQPDPTRSGLRKRTKRDSPEPTIPSFIHLPSP